MSESYACDSPASSSSGSNPRKRARPSDMSVDERKEARAQRNRIAAQCSRDRRKQQFADLEIKVAELEEENRRLRAGATEPPKVQQKPDPEQEKREKENEELRERVRQLEKAWENVSLLLSSIGANANGLNPLASLAVSPNTLSSSPSDVIPPTQSVPTDMDSTNESVRHLARVAYGVNSSLSVAPSLQRTNSTSSSRLLQNSTPPSPPTLLPTQLLQMKTSSSMSGSTPSFNRLRSNRKPLARPGTLRPPGRSRIRIRLCRR